MNKIGCVLCLLVGLNLGVFCTPRANAGFDGLSDVVDALRGIKSELHVIAGKCK